MKLVIDTSYGGFEVSKEFFDHYNIPYHEFIGSYIANEDWTDDIRKDARLIEYIEKFGSKSASGKYSCLEVVEIPKGTKYIISEYDGCESLITEDDIEWNIAD